MEKMTGNVRELAERQRAAYEAATENFLALQRRGMSFAEDGLKLMEMQQGNFKAAQKWWADGVGLMQRQQRSAQFAQGWMLSGSEALQKQTQQNLELAGSMAGGARKQQESVKNVAEAWMGAYQNFFAPFVKQAEDNVKAMKPAMKSATKNEGGSRKS